VLLPSPTLYYYRKDQKVHLTAEFGQREEDNPLASDSTEAHDDLTQQPPVARTKIFKLQREVKQKNDENQQLRKQLVQAEAKVTATLQTERGQADVEMLDVADARVPAPAKTQVDAMKDLAADESLSEDARESAKKALGMLVASQIIGTEQTAMDNLRSHELKNLRSGAQFNDQLLNQNEMPTDSVAAAARRELLGWLRDNRLLRYAEVMTRVAGKDASSADLVYLTEEDIETVCGAMTNVEKTRLSAALQALRDKEK
jgi:hypothetical protein